MNENNGAPGFLGLLAVAVTGLASVVVALLGSRASSKAAILNHDDGLRKTWQEEVKSLSQRLEEQIELRNKCEEEKTALRIRHDKEIEDLQKQASTDRHTLRAQIRELRTRCEGLEDLLRENDIEFENKPSG